MLKPRFLPTGNLPGRAGTVWSRVWASDMIQHDVEVADVDMIRFVGFLFCLFLPVTSLCLERAHAREMQGKKHSQVCTEFVPNRFSFRSGAALGRPPKEISNLKTVSDLSLLRAKSQGNGMGQGSAGISGSATQIPSASGQHGPDALYPQSQHRGIAVAHAEGWSSAVFGP